MKDMKEFEHKINKVKESARRKQGKGRKRETSSPVKQNKIKMIEKC